MGEVCTVRRAFRSVSPSQSMAMSFFAESAAAFVESFSSFSFASASSSLVRWKRSHAACEKNIAYTSPLTRLPPCWRVPSRSEPQIIAFPSSAHFGWKSS